MTAINFDDDLELEENAWRGRIVTVLVLLTLTAAIGLAIWYFRREDSLSITRETEEIPVTRGTIRQTLSITGTADAELNSDLVFQASGKVASVNVKTGDVVRQDDVLAVLESEDAENAVASAQANARSAQLKLDDLLEGTEAADVATAEQGVAAAQAGLTKAQNDYDTLLQGGTSADVAGAQQVVSAAEAQLATAQANREKLNDTPSDADIAAAEAGVAQAESALTGAENMADSAENGLATAESSLKNAEIGYCDLSPIPIPAFCSTLTAPISSADQSLMNDALDGTNLSKALAVLSANSAYLSAANSKASADASVQSAEDALSSAQAKLDAANDGPSAEDEAAAEAGVKSAEAGLTAAKEKLALVEGGGTDFQRSTAAAAVQSADAALDAALAKRNQAYRGADANAIEQARQAVRTAQLQVEAAQIRLKNAKIIAPFDGTVGAVNIKQGEFFGGASAAAEGGAIVLLTPNRLTLSMSVGETDYRSVKIGQGGAAVFDGIPGAVYPFAVTEIGLSPTVTQGVVTYSLKASLVVLPDNASPAPGMNARGQIVTSSKENVLLVPSRAIRIRGTDQVVDVKRDSGTEEQVVTTGASDGGNVEVLTGLDEGDIVTVVTIKSGGAGSTPEAEPTLPGGVR
ncbi:MAG: biotin/lipoyl-binding protein [Chloroflexi bacterium]|nr:biotin/lipoyl-binding protein [Chloroflexota bacterium]